MTTWGGVQSVISKVGTCTNQGYSRLVKFLVCKVGRCELFCLPLRLGLHFLEVQTQILNIWIGEVTVPWHEVEKRDT